METGKAQAVGLELHLGYWLRRVSNHASGRFARALQARQTSVAEWVVLCQVEASPGITPGELAAALDLTRGAISKVVDKLEAKQWVQRAASPNDNRVQWLTLTRRGGRVLPELAEIADGNDRRFFNCLEPAERAELRRLLGKIAEKNDIRQVPVE